MPTGATYTARGSPAATGAATTAATNSGNQLTAANNVSSLLVPTLENQIANPQGINPTDLAALRTSNEQGAGGAAASAVGQGALRAARTRNAGAAPAATAAGVNSAGQQLSQANLDTNLANQKAKMAQTSQAEGGLEGLYGTDLNAGNNALGQVAGDVNANNQAENASYDWATDVFDPILQAAGQGAGAVAKGCWIAEAVYGADDPRTHMLRFWLNGPFSETCVGAAAMAVYWAIGRPVAWLARRSHMARAALKPLFDAALRRACA